MVKQAKRDIESISSDGSNSDLFTEGFENIPDDSDLSDNEV